MQLLLIRHAIAEERDPVHWPDDARRPLTDRGVARFEQVARTLASRGIRPDVLFSSRYVRAWQTAEILTRRADWTEPIPMPALEFDSSGEIINAVNESARDERIALIGHEPTLGELASTLLTGSDTGMEIEVKKGGVICLECGSRVQAGEAMLRWYLTPKFASDGAGE